MKHYTKSNFFKHTFCDFIKVENSFFDENKTHFKSASGSQYYFTEEGVYRYSNHWGRVANCRWRLVSESRVKNQEYHVGYAKWINFYPLNESEKQINENRIQLFRIIEMKTSTKTEFRHEGSQNNSY